MGTRPIRDDPWLVVDDHMEAELRLRSKLLDQRRDEVLAEPEIAGGAAHELEAMVAGAGIPTRAGASPLERLGRSVQEDFCLLRRGPDEWELEAAVLCFPSQWRLTEKVGRPLTEVHGPTPGYKKRLAQPMTTTLDRLAERTVVRRNWFIYANPALFQPDRPTEARVIRAAQCGAELWVRSERQTLRRLPDSGWIVFTIRVQRCRFEELAVARRADFGTWLVQTDPVQKSHTGVAPEQEAELDRYLRNLVL